VCGFDQFISQFIIIRAPIQFLNKTNVGRLLATVERLLD